VNRFDRIFLIVMDSVGIGELPDAKLYNDLGANTIGHISARLGGLAMPHLQAFGLGNIAENLGFEPATTPIAHYGKMQELSVGKDTTAGHWEIMGVEVKVPFKTYPNGFPDSLIHGLEERVGRKVIGNKPASGTEILDELGQEQMENGSLIVYTSADSVLQIAAHEEIVPLEELYRICEIAREMTLNEEHMVGRVIARPFLGQPGNFVRTANRRDYSVKPIRATVMNELVDSGFDSIAIGKISDIYAGEGVSQSIKTKSNMDGVDKLLDCMDLPFKGLSFLNLVDFDAKYGHRRDPLGYGRALEEFDARLPEILQKLREKDLLIITADHGNDPTHHGTDHTREYVPLFAYYPNIIQTNHLGIRKTFADIGATIADNFGIERPRIGESFLRQI
jgi:phosphopentomutase